MLRVIKFVNKETSAREDFYHAESALSNIIPLLIPRVPVFIVGDDVFRKITKTEFNENSEKYPVEALACYYHDFKVDELNAHYPKDVMPNVICNSILVCEDRIKKIADRIKPNIRRPLLSIVLIHEFAHAYMDIADPDPSFFSYDDKDKIFENCEESWANAFTLSAIESSLSKIGFSRKEGVPDLLDLAAEFIAKYQPDEYSLGAFLWKCGISDEYDYWAYNKHQKDIWNSWIAFAMKQFSAYKSSPSSFDSIRTDVLKEWKETKNMLNS